MVEHIVFFKRRAGATPELEQQLVAALQGLKDKVPGILELSCGTNITPERGKGFTLALRVLFPDRQALAQYGPHPNHQAVLPLVQQYAEELVVVDYEV